MAIDGAKTKRPVKEQLQFGDSYTKFLKYCSTLAKSKQPKGKRYYCLVAALKFTF